MMLSVRCFNRSPLIAINRLSPKMPIFLMLITGKNFCYICSLKIARTVATFMDRFNKLLLV